MSESLSLEQARASWFARQGLDERSHRPIAEIVASSGWLRTLGGADVYLAARARQPGMKRLELDAFVASGALCVAPAARGCIYLVPSGVVADLMAFNGDDWRKATERDLGKVGKTMRDLDKLGAQIREALGSEALTTDAIRKRLGKAVASLGDAGKKAGMSSLLPATLRMLEIAGEIERTLEGGRLDGERYQWRRVTIARTPSAQPLRTVVEAFLGFAAPATLGQLAAWSGRPQRDLLPVLEACAVRVDVTGMGEAWVKKGDLAGVKAAPPPEGVALLAFEDNYLINHGPLGMVADARHHAMKLDIWGGSKPQSLAEAEHILSRTIVIDGLVAGAWEVDPKRNAAVWMTFDPAPKTLAARLDAQTHEAARFLLDELGHARAFSLDTMDDVQSRADRIAKLRSGRSGQSPKAKAQSPSAKTARAASIPKTKRSRPRPKASSARSRP
jgi:hypothetical protein